MLMTPDVEFDLSNVNEAVKELINTWRTEIECPEILPYNEDLVNEMKTALEEQQAIIDTVIANENKKDGEYFTATLYQMDLDRIRYSIVKYLRVRAKKIEDSVDFIISNITIMDRLSKQEKVFASKLHNLNNNLMGDVIARIDEEDIRGLFESSEDRLRHCQPQLDKYVFFTPLKDITINTEDGNSQRLVAYSIVILPYLAVRQHVLTKQGILL